MSIYDNTSAFGLMPPEMQAEMKAHYAAGGKIEFYGGSEWRLIDPAWPNNCVYRAVKSATTPDVIAWDRLPAWVQWVARDGNGISWGFGENPKKYNTGWYAVTAPRRIDDFPGIVQIGTCSWEDSFQQKPEGL